MRFEWAAVAAVALALGAVALAWQAGTAPATAPTPASPPARLEQLLDEGPAAVAPLMDGPLAPVVLGELQRRALADALRTSIAAGMDTLDLGTFAADAPIPLDPAEPAGAPQLDGIAALRTLHPPPGPFLVQAPPARLADYVAGCAVHGRWCLAVDEAFDARALAATTPAEGLTAPQWVDRVGEALPDGVAALWVLPDGPAKLRIRRGR